MICLDATYNFACSCQHSKVGSCTLKIQNDIYFFCAGSRRLTEAVDHTGKTYDDIGEMLAEQVCMKTKILRVVHAHSMSSPLCRCIMEKDECILVQSPGNKVGSDHAFYLPNNVKPTKS